MLTLIGLRPQVYYMEGYVAYTGGQVVQNCPYPLGSKAEIEWIKGWWKGYREDLVESQIVEYEE